jgi:signal transduction histidine kinase
VSGLRARLAGLPREDLRRLLFGLAALTLVQAALAVYFVLTTDQEHDTAVGLLAALVVGLSFAGTGLFAWWRRPANPVGLLMWLTGFFWFFSTYTLSDAAVPFVAGFLVTNVSYGLLINLLLVFPDGGLRTKLERMVVAGGYIAVIPMHWVAAVLIEPSENVCEDCRDNPILLVEDQSVYEAWNVLQSLVAIVVLIGLVVALVRRWRGWPRDRRAQFAPVLWAGGLGLAVLSLAIFVDLLTEEGNAVRESLFILSLASLAVIPFAFLFGLLRSRISRAEAVGDLIARLGEGEGRGLREALADALSDPSVELAYWVPESSSYVGADGLRVGLPGPDDDRLSCEVNHEGRRVGAIVHAGKLEDSAELVEAIGSAAGLRMENERLDAELRARLDELHASRARIVEAGYRERRRVERDLHDGAQQRLMALALNLKLARTKVDEDPAQAGELLDEATAELEQATAELRELARGIHPGLLTDRGLVPALEALASRAPVPVQLKAAVDPRPPSGVEAATYFLVSEALANVAKHSGAEHASVTVAQANGSLTVEVADDGRGGADPRGSGLQGLADRVAALDGTFSVAEGAGGGTVVRASIPLG